MSYIGGGSRLSRKGGSNKNGGDHTLLCTMIFSTPNFFTFLKNTTHDFLFSSHGVKLSPSKKNWNQLL